MKPPFAQFPTIPWGSIGWRMGQGEDYWIEWTKWFQQLSVYERETYKSQWPESDGWIGFFEMIEHGTTPPHVLEERRLTELAAAPPHPDETRITDKYRCRWLMTKHFKHLYTSSKSVNSANNLVFADPKGNEWIFVGPTSVGESGYLERVVK